MKLGGGRGTLEEAAAAAEILKSTGRSGSQPHNFGTCTSKLSGETWYSAIISKQTGEISQVQVDGLGPNLAISFLCSEEDPLTVIMPAALVWR